MRLAASLATSGVAAGLLLAAAPVHADIPDIGKDWIKVRSGHIVAYSAWSGKDTKRVVDRIHGFRSDVFGPGRPFSAPAPDGNLIVFLFGHDRHLRFYEPFGYDAWFQFADGVDYLLISQESWEDHLELALSMEAYLILADAHPGLPYWVGHGLSSFYSTYHARGDRVKVGHKQKHAFETLRHYKPLPWERVLEIGEYSPEVHDGITLRVFDAQAWILTHYLITELDTGNETGEQALARYVAYLDVGSDRDAAFRDVYGFPRSELAKRAQAYSKTPGFDAIEFRVQREKTPERTQSVPTRQELLSELGGMIVALNSGANREVERERRGLAEAHLRAALELEPDLATAHRALGEMYLRSGEAVDAVEPLRKAVRLAPDDLRSNYLLARALLAPYRERRVRFTVRENKAAPKEILEAREHLKVCLSLDPQFGDVLILLGQSYLHDPGDPGPGLSTLQRIQRLYPGRSDIRSTIVLMHLRRGEEEAVFSGLDPGDPTDPELQELRTLAIDRALAAARRAVRARDLARGRVLLELVRDRGNPWGLRPEEVTRLEEIQTMLAAVEGLMPAGSDLAISFSGPRPNGRVLPPAEERRQYDEYTRALELSRAKKYKKALEVLDALIALPNADAMRPSLLELRDQVRYNRALVRYEQGKYEEALAMARQARKNTASNSVKALCKLLIDNCKLKLGL